MHHADKSTLSPRVEINDDLVRDVRRVRSLPNEAKLFEVDGSGASRYGLSPDDLAVLEDLGLPSVTTADGRRYAGADLHYVALRAGVFREHLEAMSQWRQMLELCSANRSVTVKVSYLPLPDGVSCAEPRLARVLLGGDQEDRRPLIARKAIATVRSERRSWCPPLPAALDDVVDAVARLDFYLIPPSLAADTKQIRSTGLADCDGGTNLLLEEARRVGVPARAAHGLLLSAPFSRRHTWTEVLVDGVWVACDPLLLSAMQRFAGLDRHAWPLTRSPGAVLLRLSSAGQAPVSVDGCEIETVYWTEVLSA